MLREIDYSGRFTRDFKREMRGRHPERLEAALNEVIEALSNNTPMAPRFRDHALSGDWKDHRECHVKPDLLLIYRLPDPNTLQLVRLGSHSELGL